MLPQELKGRLNVMFSDYPFASLFGEDVVPTRRHIYHVSNLPPGTSTYQLVSAAATLNLGWPRAKLEVRSTGSMETLVYFAIDELVCQNMLTRQHIYHVSNLPAGTSTYQLVSAAASLNLGWPRAKLEVRLTGISCMRIAMLYF